MNVCRYVYCVWHTGGAQRQFCRLVLPSALMWVLGGNPNLLNCLMGPHLLFMILEVLGMEPETLHILRKR